jgi:hypothetical protein
MLLFPGEEKGCHLRIGKNALLAVQTLLLEREGLVPNETAASGEPIKCCVLARFG